MPKNKMISIAVVLLLGVGALTLLFFSIETSTDGAGGLALVLNLGFLVTGLLVFFTLWKALQAFTNKNITDTQTTQYKHLLKQGIFPLVLAFLINALMIQGYTGWTGFVNTVSEAHIIGLFAVYVLAPNEKRTRFVLGYLWLSVLFLLLFALVEYLFLG